MSYDNSKYKVFLSAGQIDEILTNLSVNKAGLDKKLETIEDLMDALVYQCKK
tara:strand:+ start:619 stop:774 length:156 start_codon:yes stop_codon:yes gene_type:complete